jgi:hypothetical protein
MRTSLVSALGALPLCHSAQGLRYAAKYSCTLSLAYRYFCIDMFGSIHHDRYAQMLVPVATVPWPQHSRDESIFPLMTVNRVFILTAQASRQVAPPMTFPANSLQLTRSGCYVTFIYRGGICLFNSKLVEINDKYVLVIIYE